MSQKRQRQIRRHNKQQCDEQFQIIISSDEQQAMIEIETENQTQQDYLHQNEIIDIDHLFQQKQIYKQDLLFKTSSLVYNDDQKICVEQQLNDQQQQQQKQPQEQQQKKSLKQKNYKQLQEQLENKKQIYIQEYHQQEQNQIQQQQIYLLQQSQQEQLQYYEDDQQQIQLSQEQLQDQQQEQKQQQQQYQQQEIELNSQQLEQQQELQEKSNQYLEGPKINNKRQSVQLDLTQSLLYMDEPGLEIFIHSDPDISNLIKSFLPASLLDIFLQNVNQALKLLLQDDLQKFDEKRFELQEIFQFFGMNILFGIVQLPSESHYWHSEEFLRGCINLCMQEGRYEFIQKNLMDFNQCDNLKAIHLVDQIRSKWRKIYRPDQELILNKQVKESFTNYYLFDCQTLFILDQTIIFKGQSQQILDKMLLSYGGLNHNIYFVNDVIDIDLVIRLSENQIYPIGQVDDVKEFNLDDLDKRMLFTKDNDNLFLSVRGLNEDPAQQSQKYRNKRQKFQITTDELIAKVNEFRSPFCFSKRDHEENPQYIRVLFEEFLETTLCNIFTLINSILINNHQTQTFREFKLAAGGALVGNQYSKLEKVRKEIIRRINLTTSSKQIQTEKSSFGLPTIFQNDEFHIPHTVSRSVQIKYCLVCMKFQNLSKSYFDCLLCLKVIGLQVYLCAIPCFDLFHQSPRYFIDPDYKFSRNTKNEQFYLLNISKKQDSEHNQPEKQIEKQNLQLPEPYSQQVRNFDPTMNIQNYIPKNQFCSRFNQGKKDRTDTQEIKQQTKPQGVDDNLKVQNDDEEEIKIKKQSKPSTSIETVLRSPFQMFMDQIKLRSTKDQTLVTKSEIEQ